MLKKSIANNFDVIYTVFQVWLAGFVILVACFLGVFTYSSFLGATAELSVYRQLFVVITGIILSCSWLMGLYHSRKSILNVEEYRAIYKTILISFLVTSTCLYLLREMEGIVPGNSVFFEYLKRMYKPLEVESATDLSRVIYILIFVFSYLFLTLQRAVAFNFMKK